MRLSTMQAATLIRPCCRGCNATDGQLLQLLGTVYRSWREMLELKIYFSELGQYIVNRWIYKWGRMQEPGMMSRQPRLLIGREARIYISIRDIYEAVYS
jgi:hypothetical protein